MEVSYNKLNDTNFTQIFKYNATIFKIIFLKYIIYVII